MADSFVAFCAAVESALAGKATDKGYHGGGPDSPNPLDDFSERFFPGHRLGEVLYKCVRFRKKGNVEDLEKAAAWLFLEWRAAKKQG